MINYLNELPKSFFDINPSNVLETFPTSTIISLKGKIKQPVFVSSMIHGNETSSLTILKSYLKKFTDKELPRDLIIFIGNPVAYSKGLRHLPNQLDYNRIWNTGQSYEHLMAREVYDYLKNRNLLASLDFHNNSGKNPHYACVNRRREDFLRLGQFFSEKIVYFTEPDSVLSIKMAKLCPSLTLECGLPESKPGIENGLHLLETAMGNKSVWKNSENKITNIYQSYATLLVHPLVKLDYDFNERTDGISLVKDFDSFNFSEVPKGFQLGFIADSRTIKCVNNQGVNITHEFLEFESNCLRVKKEFTASMFTVNPDIAKSDCLGYLMKKIPVNDFLNF